jgi:hypothetical protein
MGIAHHLTQIENLTKQISSEFLRSRYLEAHDIALYLVTETRLLMAALSHEHEEQIKKRERGAL